MYKERFTDIHSTVAEHKTEKMLSYLTFTYAWNK